MAERPNILLIVSDQHSNQVMGCAGDEVVRTPHLDALAARGTMFEHAQCAAPLCVPSRMTMLTGRHCSDIEVWTNECVLRSEIPTFGHALGAAGYETVLCGRMHFLGPDQRHGFHRRIIGDMVDYTHQGRSGSPLTPELVPATGQTYPAVAVSGAGRTAYQAYDEAVLARGQEYLAGREGDRPLLMVAGFVLPHCPFVARKDLFDHYYERVQMPGIPEGYSDNLHPAMQQWREARGITDLTEEQIRSARAGYYGLVEHFDEIVGGLMRALEQSALADNTVVIYVSDHGDCAGHNGLWWKSNFYDHSVGVPLIMAGPGVPQGRRRSEVVSLLDLPATLSELGQAPALPLQSGQSLLPLARNEAAWWRDEAIAEMIGTGPRYPFPGRMIRRGPWKLMHYEGHAPLLFKLDEDPGEFEDRAADPSCRDVRDYLHDRVRQGWDPERALHTMRRLRSGGGLIRQWGRLHLDPGPGTEHWEAPEGCNTWPE